VTDFISRLAARAVAQPSRARPAVPAVSAVTAEPVARTPQVVPEAPVVRAVPVSPAVRSEAPEVRAERAQRPQPATERLVTEPTIRERVVDKTVVRDRVVPRREPVEAARMPEPAPEPAEIVPATPVATAPVAARVVEKSVTRSQPAAGTTAEEPPVRVRIGRLEVRANLEQAAPPAPQHAPRTDRSEGLSLGDYLRGRRSA